MILPILPNSNPPKIRRDNVPEFLFKFAIRIKRNSGIEFRKKYDLNYLRWFSQNIDLPISPSIAAAPGTMSER